MARVFLNFHYPDLSGGFVSDLRNLLESKGITTFKDENIERGHHPIGPETVKAIKESMVSIVLISRNYVSSSYCLDELVEILKCREASGQIVIPVFYDIPPSYIRLLERCGEFRGVLGRAFKKTCEGETEEVKLRWTKALAHIGTMAGLEFRHWSDETAMAAKIASDVSDRLKKG